MGGLDFSARAVVELTLGVPYQKFVSGDGAQSIWHVPLAGGTPVKITTPAAGDDHNSPVVDPNGRTRLAYLNRVSGGGGDLELRIVNADGSGDTLIDTGHHRILDWSPDGSTIAFTTFNAGEEHQIFTINPDGTGRTAIHSATPGDLLNRPVYSHDGTKIAFQRNVTTPGTGHEFGEVWVMGADGSSPTKLDDVYDGYLLEVSLGWSPDDTRIGYATGGNPLNTYLGGTRTAGRWVVIDADGSNRVEVGSETPGSGNESESSKLSWVPDGSAILVPQWTADNRWSVKVCQADGSGEALMSPTLRVYDRPIFCFLENGRVYVVAYEEPVFTSITFDSVLPDGSDRRVEDPDGFNILLEWFE